MSMCRLADTEGENGFWGNAVTNPAGLQSEHRMSVNPGDEHSVWSQQQPCPALQSPSCAKRLQPSHLISDSPGSPPRSPSISPRNLTVQDQVQHSGALGGAVSPLPVAGDFQSHYQGMGTVWVEQAQKEEIVYLGVEEGCEQKWCNSWRHAPQFFQTQKIAGWKRFFSFSLMRYVISICIFKRFRSGRGVRLPLLLLGFLYFPP